MKIVYYIIPACSILFVSFLLRANVEIENKNMFKIIIGVCEENTGSVAPQVISSLGNGKFLGFQGEEFGDEYIKEYLSKISLNGRSVLILKIGNEKETSVLEFSRILIRLKKLANPKLDTTIYVQFANS